MRRLWLVLVLAAVSNIANGDPDGVSVVGVAEVKAKPNRLELEIRNSGVAELAGDAAVKLRDASRRTMTAYEKLKVPNLRLEPLGVAINQEQQATPQEQVMFNGRQVQTAAAKIEVARPIRIVVTGVDKLPEDELLTLAAKLLDTAKDTGAKVGPPTVSSIQGYYFRMMFGGGNERETPNNLIVFTLDDAGAAREQAVERAFAEARVRAERLAKLAGGELGPVLSVSETYSEQMEGDLGTVKVQANASAGADSKKGARLVANQLMEIPVRVSLQVRFGLRPAGSRN
jgi:uncharacterized protein YggE